MRKRDNAKVQHLASRARMSRNGNPASGFSARQREIWRLRRRGVPNKMVAQALGISPAAVSQQWHAALLRSAALRVRPHILKGTA